MATECIYVAFSAVRCKIVRCYVQLERARGEAPYQEEQGERDSYKLNASACNDCMYRKAFYYTQTHLPACSRRTPASSFFHTVALKRFHVQHHLVYELNIKG